MTAVIAAAAGATTSSVTVAARGGTWGGRTVGLVALVIFLAFAAYIVVARLRQRTGKDGRPR